MDNTMKTFNYFVMMLIKHKLFLIVSFLVTFTACIILYSYIKSTAGVEFTCYAFVPLLAYVFLLALLPFEDNF